MPIPETLVESVVTSGENGFSAAVLLKDALFDRIDFRRPKPFSFNLIFNDRDGGDDRRGHLFRPRHPRLEILGGQCAALSGRGR